MKRRICALLLGLLLLGLGTIALGEGADPSLAKIWDVGVYTDVREDGSDVLSFLDPGVDRVRVPANLDDTQFFTETYAETNSRVKTVVYDGMTTIPRSWRLEYLYNLERIEIGASVREIELLLSSAPGVKEFVVDAGNPIFQSIDGVVYSKDGKELVLVPPALEKVVFVVPEGTERIADGAFYHNDTIKSISLPASMSVLSEGAFRRCLSLETVSMPLTLQAIGPSAFYECVSLERIVIPKGVKSIGAGAFVGCERLREIVIPGANTLTEPGAINSVAMDIAIYAPEGSWAHRWAQACGMRWAVPGGQPVQLTPSRGATAVVNNLDRKDTLALYQASSRDSTRLANLENGTTLELLGWDGGWAHVVYGNMTGYVQAGTRPALLEADGRTARKLSPGEVYKMPEDCLLMLMDPLTDLVSIQCDVSGTFPTVYVQDGISYDSERWVYGYTMPLRGAADFDFYDTSYITPIALMGEWAFVIHPRYDNYCYVVLEEYKPLTKDTSGREFGLVYNPDYRDRLNFRDRPSKNGNLLGKYFNGTQMEILGREGEWLHVVIGGQKGYVLSEFVKVVERNDWEWGY